MARAVARVRRLAFVRAVAGPLNAGRFARDPVLINQLRKSMLSIYANFAEGFERDGNREFAQFLAIAKGSAGEIRGQLLYAVDLGYLSTDEFDPLNALGVRTTACVGGLIHYLNTTEFRGRKFKQRESGKKRSDRGSRIGERRTVNDERRTVNAERRTVNAER